VKVPSAILKLHRYVTLAADLFFCQSDDTPFSLTYTQRICFTAVNHLADRLTKTIFKAYHKIHYFYLKRGFYITTLNVDGEFTPLQVPIQSIPGGPKVNLTSANEHVPKIKRCIQVEKERARSFQHSLPFNRIPKLLTIHIVFVAVKLLNHFPPKEGISDMISPKTIMTGGTLDYKTHLSLQLGQYCQVHEDDTPRNSQLPRTQGAICLGPSGNIQGSFKFMSLTSAKKIVQRIWDKIPMPQTVIDRVNHLGKDQPEQFIFTDRKGQPIGNVKDLPGADNLDTDADNELAGVDREIETPQNLEPIPETMNQTDDLNINENNQGIEEDAIPDDNQEVEPAPVEQSPDTQVEDTQVEDIPPTTTAPDVTPGVRRSTRVRMQTRDNDYIPSLSGSSKHAYAVTQLERHGALHPDAHMLFQTDMYHAEPDVVAAIITQLSLKAGLREWGKEAQKAVHSEMKQLHFRDTFRPMHWRDLTHAQRKSILESHMFLKQKRTGAIKGRTVGNKQGDFISKEEASSPMVATKSVLLTCIIDAEERRDVAVVDIPNAFIQTRIEDEKDMAIIKIREILVDMLLAVASDTYTPYVTVNKKGVKQLIVQCLNIREGDIPSLAVNSFHGHILLNCGI
jgi:hypothetical protein